MPVSAVPTIAQKITKQGADAISRTAGAVVRAAQEGKPLPPQLGVNSSDEQVIKQLAKKQEQGQQKAAPVPLKAGDGSLPGTISTALQTKGATLEGYPYAKPKRDKDPRHPANKGVSARPGFVGGS